MRKKCVLVICVMFLYVCYENRWRKSVTRLHALKFVFSCVGKWMVLKIKNWKLNINMFTNNDIKLFVSLIFLFFRFCRYRCFLHQKTFIIFCWWWCFWMWCPEKLINISVVELNFTTHIQFLYTFWLFT